MRYRVDFTGGYISYDESEYDQALATYEERGIRMLECDDIFDDGRLVKGQPVVVDYSNESKN